MGVVTLSPVSWPAGSPHSLCSHLGEVVVGLGPESSPYIKGGAGQGVRPAQGIGWDLSTNQEAFLSPAPMGQAFLSPVPSSRGWHLQPLNFLRIRGQAPSGGPAGGGTSPTRVPGRELASGAKRLQGA